MMRHWLIGWLLLVVVFGVGVSVVFAGSSGEEIAVDLSYLARGKGELTFRQLADGGSLESGDSFKIVFTPSERCYVYIYQIDSAGLIYQLFPMEEFGGVWVGNRNPVQAGKTYYIPAEDKSFELDEVTGLETIYLVASHTPETELERQYQRVVQIQHEASGMDEEDLARVDQALEELEAALAMKGRTKGVARLVPDEGSGEPVTWEEDGQFFSILQQRLEGLCDGCVNILEFQHR
ncbi:DUF4384 domain-containing protein [candidate division KSB3 bacterium]|uniref:DUF4384 domain-containing protein n=1 Tax=candidate division KSB3 bacterium TaxID=2044937 RepID=A0A9D5JXY0_9BACT|nr:DUF4384 domain-containing protein [candidate division KSB3 bacterium]MBD3326001.1 DUF4384 domain-containing protein [candidate division KSB3 bacterium]